MDKYKILLQTVLMCKHNTKVSHSEHLCLSKRLAEITLIIKLITLLKGPIVLFHYLVIGSLTLLVVPYRIDYGLLSSL